MKGTFAALPRDHVVAQIEHMEMQIAEVRRDAESRIARIKLAMAGAHRELGRRKQQQKAELRKYFENEFVGVAKRRLPPEIYEAFKLEAQQLAETAQQDDARGNQQEVKA
jgi:hypothetical protein